MNTWLLLSSPLAALILSPLLAGIINRTKAHFAGRKGQPLLQGYYDLIRLFQKGMVFSNTTSWVFRVAPVLIFFCTLAATFFVPFLPEAGFGFTGDVIVLLYLLGLARFFIIISALDTGSAFEGMGASREAFFSALAEPVMFICMLNVMRVHDTTSVVEALSSPMSENALILVLTIIPVFIVLLMENARIPFDDPNTHLELTMIHEVMILDNSGPGLAFMEYAAALKLWLFALIAGRIVIPISMDHPVLHTVVLLALMVLVAVGVGTIESVMARLRLTKIPQILFGGGVIALVGFFISTTNKLLW